ncbi:hypothetical protein IIA16_05390, partial [bacterium]|nr:hypothetical protein [bacterium]
MAWPVASAAAAVATGGTGGASGNNEARAGGGFNFDNGSLLINPGRSGSGGCAVAIGTPGVIACPGTKGGDAIATGGNGGDNRKKLTIRGVSAADLVKIALGPLSGGDGGWADAMGGDGGDGMDGPPGCDGGAGGFANAFGGDGGDVSYSSS